MEKKRFQKINNNFFNENLKNIMMLYSRTLFIHIQLSIMCFKYFKSRFSISQNQFIFYLLL